ncbi:MAG: hypothetical protein ACK521_02110 [bacterium]
MKYIFGEPELQYFFLPFDNSVNINYQNSLCGMDYFVETTANAD